MIESGCEVVDVRGRVRRDVDAPSLAVSCWSAPFMLPPREQPLAAPINSFAGRVTSPECPTALSFFHRHWSATELGLSHASC